MNAENPVTEPVTFDADEDGVHVRDRIEDEHLHLSTPEPPEIDPALTDLFVFPVDAAVSFTTCELRVGAHGVSFLRDEDGEHRGEFTTATREVLRGTHFVEVSGTVKTYIRIADAAFSGVYLGTEHESPLRLTFDEPTQVTVGARSAHTQPQATLTVPDDPHAVAEAISHLGSSLKEISCERSWPSLRGHPPAIERGDHLRIPAGIERPDTGVTVTTAPTYADLYRVAPLAFYLGADVETSGAADESVLHLANGYTEPLGTGHELETTVDQLLGQCLLLDSLTRADGYYSLPRYEYEELAPHLPFYPPNLYDVPLSEQLMEYLEVSADVLEPYLPRWPTTAVLRPEPADVELLPQLLDSLARIHVGTGTEAGTDRGGGDLRRSGGAAGRATAGTRPSLVTAHTTDPPAGDAALVPASFSHARECTVPVRGDATLRFVTADADRAARLRELPTDEGGLTPASVEVVHRPTREQLRDAFAASTDFLHCDLPATSAGFECVDGTLGIADVDTVGTTMFGLQGEASLDAGISLVDRGAVAGVVSGEVPSLDRLRRLVAVLLAGHALAASAEAASLGGETDHRFVGDAARVLVRLEGGGVPVRIDVTSVDPDAHALTIWSQTTDRHLLGGVSRFAESYAPAAYQLHGASVEPPFHLSTEEVVSLLADDDVVVRLNGELVLDADPTPAVVRESARRHAEDG